MASLRTQNNVRKLKRTLLTLYLKKVDGFSHTERGGIGASATFVSKEMFCFFNRRLPYKALIVGSR